MMPKVWVTQETSHNFADAERYGEIEFITREDLNNTRNSLHNEAVLDSIKLKLRNFNESEDWIVIAGSPYVAAAVFMMLGKAGVRDARILRWDRRDYVYAPMYLQMRG